jgi:ribonuclease Z
MRPLLHPTLVNGRFGDPALYVEALFDRRTVLFDLGDIQALPPRKIQRLEHVCVSHAHIDHFIGFDYLLRVLVGRDKTINLFGPPGFVDHVCHKLHAYQWNLAAHFVFDLIVVVTEIHPSGQAHSARFRLKRAFAMEAMDSRQITDGVILRDPTFKVTAALLEHGTPCLGFAMEEAVHVNIWKSRLAELRLPVGPWLRELKRAVVEHRPDNHLISVGGHLAPAINAMPLAELRQVLTVTPGQKIAYVTDVADTPGNRTAIVRLVRRADLLFIEAAFAREDRALAAERAHLTTATAGELARRAGVRRVEPFHFSPRYHGQEAQMLAEVAHAFGR